MRATADFDTADIESAVRTCISGAAEEASSLTFPSDSSDGVITMPSTVTVDLSGLSAALDESEVYEVVESAIFHADPDSFYCQRTFGSAYPDRRDWYIGCAIRSPQAVSGYTAEIMIGWPDAF